MDIRGRNAIKPSLLALAVAAAGLLGSVQSANAQQPFNFAPEGAAGATYNINGLAFGPGNALAVNALPAGGSLVVGETFQVYFQTHLTGLSGPNAPNVTPGLNSTYQITEVGTLTETVSQVTNGPGGQTAVFTLVPGAATNRISIYSTAAGGGVVFNDAAGTGFTAGTEIARLGPQNFTGSSFTNTSFGTGTTVPFNQTGAGNMSTPLSIVGGGGTTLNNSVDFTSPIYFQPPTGNPALVSSLFTSSLNTPFSAISPSIQFTNPIGGATFNANDGAVNGSSGPDVQFQVAGFTQTFTVVPEPASVTLMGLGVVGALVVVRRKRAQVA